MKFRAYDILTQLIPGTLIVGFTIYVTKLSSVEVNFNFGLAAFGVVICFLVGYIVNVVGQILESFLSKRLHNLVFQTYCSGQIKYPLKVLQHFTKLKYIEKKSTLSPKNFETLFEKLISKQNEGLIWLNEDKKFARSMVVSCFVLFILSGLFGLQHAVMKYYPLVIIWILFLIAIYRYFQTSVDYTISVIKCYEQQRSQK